MNTALTPGHPTHLSQLERGLLWDEAFLRVESYLRAHHVESRVLLNELATEIIRDAKAQVLEHTGRVPMAAAMEATQIRIDAWFARVGCPGDWPTERVQEAGRLSLILANQRDRWSHAFLSSEPIPQGLSEALGAVALQPGPELNVINMAAEPLEFGFDSPSGSPSSGKWRWTTLQEASSWLLIVGLYVVLWVVTH